MPTQHPHAFSAVPGADTQKGEGGRERGREITLCAGGGATGQEDPIRRGNFRVLIMRCNQISNCLLIAGVFTLKGKSGTRLWGSTLAEW